MITGLARSVTTYDSVEDFGASPDGDWGPIERPVEMPGGTTLDRIRWAVGSFVPTGLFGGTSPMASLSGEVQESLVYTVGETARRSTLRG
ncbi:hypothetical protein ACPCG0_14135 [Propionibacteriaceae bacterium Y1923]